jgi:uncharacterized protein
MTNQLSLTFITSLQAVSAVHWNLLRDGDYPFVRYEFLAALEQSGSVGKGTGWQPQHLVVYEGDELIAALPLYIKSHSYGEYVFVIRHKKCSQFYANLLI